MCTAQQQLESYHAISTGGTHHCRQSAKQHLSHSQALLSFTSDRPFALGSPVLTLRAHDTTSPGKALDIVVVVLACLDDLCQLLDVESYIQGNRYESLTSLSEDIRADLRRQTKEMALALNVVGLMNVQFAIKGETIYVLEVNPRASRTVPFVSKATSRPLAKVAARCMSGKSLSEQGVEGEIIAWVGDAALG